MRKTSIYSFGYFRQLENENDRLRASDGTSAGPDSEGTGPAKGIEYCCSDFRSACDVTFANPIDSDSGWLLYGTDYETVSVGSPEIRFWPARFCPFCGSRLKKAVVVPARSSRRFGRS